MSDRRVGRMALTPEGLCGFEYDANWIRNGFSISPFYLPLKPGLVMAKQDPFGGNFGVFDDSCLMAGVIFCLIAICKKKG